MIAETLLLEARSISRAFGGWGYAGRRKGLGRIGFFGGIVQGRGGGLQGKNHTHGHLGEATSENAPDSVCKKINASRRRDADRKKRSHQQLPLENIVFSFPCFLRKMPHTDRRDKQAVLRLCASLLFACMFHLVHAMVHCLQDLRNIGKRWMTCDAADADLIKRAGSVVRPVLTGAQLLHDTWWERIWAERYKFISAEAVYFSAAAEDTGDDFCKML